MPLESVCPAGVDGNHAIRMEPATFRQRKVQFSGIALLITSHLDHQSPVRGELFHAGPRNGQHAAPGIMRQRVHVERWAAVYPCRRGPARKHVLGIGVVNKDDVRARRRRFLYIEP
jgi:hypothetical protein